MKIDWKPVNRQDAALEVLRYAAVLIESDGPVAVSVALASSGAQYFSDRVQALGEDSALKFMSEVLIPQLAAGGPHVAHYTPTWLLQFVKRKANALKHANRKDEPEHVSLAPELATMLIFCAIGDCFRCTGIIDEQLTQFQLRQRAALRERLTTNNPANAEKLRAFDELTRAEMSKRGFAKPAP